MNLLLVLRVRIKNFAHIFEGNNIITQAKWLVSCNRHLDFLASAPHRFGLHLCGYPNMEDGPRQRPALTLLLLLWGLPLLSAGVRHQHAKQCFSTSQKQIDHALGSKQNLRTSNIVPTCAAADPVVLAPRTFPRMLGGQLPTMHHFVRYHTGKCHGIGHGPSRPSLKR